MEEAFEVGVLESPQEILKFETFWRQAKVIWSESPRGRSSF